MADIIPLPISRGPASPIAHYIRTGESGYHQLEELHAQGRFHATRVVIDASSFRYQRKFIETLRSERVELVLDTKSAELSEPAKRAGLARHAPWAPKEETEPLGHDFFVRGTRDVIPSIAEFAVENGLSAVIAPSHFLRQGRGDAWFKIDVRACERLRRELDTVGGENVAIDYSLILPHMLLRDESVRGAIISELADVPFENLWIRASGFGSDGSASGTRAYINALSAFHNLGRPVVADCLGGLIGLSALAFGSASGLAHGVGERERFDASRWHEPPTEKDDDQKAGGRTNRVYIASVDQALTIPELKALARAPGGRRLLVCTDRECCSDLDRMIGNWRAHFLKQRHDQIKRIADVPDLRREDDFLNRDLALAHQQSEQIQDLTPVESELVPRKGETSADAKERLMARLKRHAKRDEKLRVTLENLHTIRGQGAPRARPARFRGGPRKASTSSQEKK